MSREEKTAETLLRAAQDRGLVVTGDFRISLDDAAGLVCIARGTLRNAVSKGKGPVTYELPVGRCRRSVRIRDLAIWVECRAE